MPSDPFRPCSLCGVAVRARYCDDCRSQANTRRSAGRASAHARGYDARHRRRRAWRLRRHPTCAHCARRLATILDHIVPMTRGGDPRAPLNLQGLCEACHNRKTRAEQNGIYDPTDDLDRAKVREETTQ